MNRLSKLKLSQLSKDELEARQMTALKGGGYCICFGCLCSGDESASANDERGEGYHSGQLNSMG
jgi:natural product precursor